VVPPGTLAKAGLVARSSITRRIRSHRFCSACTRVLRLEISSAIVPADANPAREINPTALYSPATTAVPTTSPISEFS